MQDNINDKDIYTLAVLRYKELYPDIDDMDLFSSEWNISNDYKTKTCIIAEALQNHIPVEQTESYQSTFINQTDKVDLKKDLM